MKKFISVFAILLALMTVLLIPANAFTVTDQLTQYEHTHIVPNTGIMDLSWMNEKPAGQHGFCQVVDGNFCFEDGTPVKFWGTTFGFSGSYPEKEFSEKMAVELAAMGVNLIRIHCIDAYFGGTCGIVDYSNFKNGLGPVTFAEANLDKMDYLIYCLKEQGIYIHLDTSAGRKVTVGEGFDETEAAISAGNNLRGATFFDERVSRIEYEFAEDFLVKHINPYTKTAYCNEPAIAIIQRANESSALWISWGELGERENGFYTKLQDRFNAWLLEKYGTREALATAWTDADGVCGLKDKEDPTTNTVYMGQLGNWSEPRVVQSTKFSSLYNPARHADWIAFLYSVQKEDMDNFKSLLRSNGYKGSFNCSNIMAGPVDLYFNSTGDVTEMNWYFNSGSASVTHSVSEFGIAKQDSPVQYFTHAATADTALVITEWEVGAITDFRADSLITVAAYASLQDWDGFCLWIYCSDKTDAGKCGFHICDPAYFGQMPLAALIFRNGLVKPSEVSVDHTYTYNDLLANDYDPRAIGSTLVYVSKYAFKYIDDTYGGDADLVLAATNVASGDYTSAKHLLLQNGRCPYSDAFHKEKTIDAWLSTYIGTDAQSTTFGGRTARINGNVAVLDEPLPNLVAPELVNDFMRSLGLWDETVGFIDGKAVSDTHELVYDYTNGFLTCAADGVCFATGKIPASTSVGVMNYSISLPRATVALVATDGKAITASESLYLYTIGETCRDNAEYDEEGFLTASGSRDGTLYYEDVRGTFSFSSGRENCEVWGLDCDGNRVAELDVSKTDNGFSFELDKYINYELRLTGGAVPSGNPGSFDPLFIIVPAVVAAALAVLVVFLIKNKKK